MEIEGRIIADLPEVGGTSKAGNQWRKKEWVLETLGQYPKKVKFDFFGDRIDSNRLEVGKTYVISYDIESREFNSRWYTDIRAFASRPAEQGGAPQGVAESPMSTPASTNPFGAPAAPAQGFAPAENGNDDLPF